MYKVGDKVTITRCITNIDKELVKTSDSYIVLQIVDDLLVWVNTARFGKYLLLFTQIEKVEESKEMTFPEMVQKLIDGEFEVGTELVADGDSYFVDKLSDGRYGLSPSKSSWEVSFKLGATSMNSTWTVKEEPVKEMSIEELQKELGYKIKIVEQ